MRVAMPPDVSAFIVARIANYAVEATEPYHRWEAAAVAEFAALPLIRHWSETFGLRPDGEVVRWHTDLDDPYIGGRPVEARYDWLSALVEGVRRWPELGALLPERPTAAVACWCVGHQGFAPGKALCPDCCGLGWVVTQPAEPGDAAIGPRL